MRQDSNYWQRHVIGGVVAFLAAIAALAVTKAYDFNLLVPLCIIGWAAVGALGVALIALLVKTRTKNILLVVILASLAFAGSGHGTGLMTASQIWLNDPDRIKQFVGVLLALVSLGSDHPMSSQVRIVVVLAMSSIVLYSLSGIMAADHLGQDRLEAERLQREAQELQRAAQQLEWEALQIDRERHWETQSAYELAVLTRATQNPLEAKRRMKELAAALSKEEPKPQRRDPPDAQRTSLQA